MVIDKQFWLRSNPHCVLLDENNNYDILGFYYLSLGFANDSLLNRKFSPKTNNISCWPGKLTFDLIEKIIGINDNIKTSDEIKEAKLKELFKTMDIELEFV